MKETYIAIMLRICLPLLPVLVVATHSYSCTVPVSVQADVIEVITLELEEEEEKASLLIS